MMHGWRSGSAFVSDAKGRGFDSRIVYPFFIFAVHAGGSQCAAINGTLNTQRLVIIMRWEL